MLPMKLIRLILFATLLFKVALLEANRCDESYSSSCESSSSDESDCECDKCEKDKRNELGNPQNYASSKTTQTSKVPKAPKSNGRPLGPCSHKNCDGECRSTFACVCDYSITVIYPVAENEICNDLAHSKKYLFDCCCPHNYPACEKKPCYSSPCNCSLHFVKGLPRDGLQETMPEVHLDEIRPNNGANQLSCQQTLTKTGSYPQYLCACTDPNNVTVSKPMKGFKDHCPPPKTLDRPYCRIRDLNCECKDDVHGPIYCVSRHSQKKTQA